MVPGWQYCDCPSGARRLREDYKNVIPPANPATLTASGDARVPARQFRILKHGLAATGMPARGKVGMSDAEVRDLVAFLQVLPTLDTAGYRRHVAASNGHSHASAEQHTTRPSQAAARKTGGKAHDRAGHKH